MGKAIRGLDFLLVWVEEMKLNEQTWSCHTMKMKSLSKFCNWLHGVKPCYHLRTAFSIHIARIAIQSHPPPEPYLPKTESDLSSIELVRRRVPHDKLGQNHLPPPQFCLWLLFLLCLSRVWHPGIDWWRESWCQRLCLCREDEEARRYSWPEDVDISCEGQEINSQHLKPTSMAICHINWRQSRGNDDLE